MRRVLCASLLLVACDGEGVDVTGGVNPEPRAPVPVAVIHAADPNVETPVVVSHVPDDAPTHLVSRFGPERGVTGSTIQILTMFDPTGCVYEWTCSVRIGAMNAPIVNDSGLLEVEVPLLAESGPVCVTFDGVEECGAVYTVLPLPLVTSMTPGQVVAGAGDTTIEILGDAFMEDAELVLGYLPLATTFHSRSHLSAVVPASMLVEPGTLALAVHSPSSGRCGTTTEPHDLIVE